MITLEQAQEIVMSRARPLGKETVSLAASLGRILGDDVASDIDMPPFNKSAMDGYACRREDLGGELRVLEIIPAGREPSKAIGPGQCSKIMTGAVVPDGADCVIMVEFTEESGSGVVRFTGQETRDNICKAGEDVRRGDVVLSAGEAILPQHVAVLASSGCAEVTVSLRPRVGIIATGSELVEPSDEPDASQIRNSNSYQLRSQCERAGALPTYHGIAPDTEDGIAGAIGAAGAESDVVLVSGGVSAGDFDLVPAMLERNGYELLFEKIKVKPGKPTVFGDKSDCVCFGLPGNPVSTFVIFELIVKPFLLAMMGHCYKPVTVPMTLKESIRRRSTDRASWVPVTIVDAGVAPCEYHGSAHVGALCAADGLLCVPTGTGEIGEGDTVDVRLL